MNKINFANKKNIIMPEAKLHSKRKARNFHGVKNYNINFESPHAKPLNKKNINKSFRGNFILPRETLPSKRKAKNFYSAKNCNISFENTHVKTFNKININNSFKKNVAIQKEMLNSKITENFYFREDFKKDIKTSNVKDFDKINNKKSYSEYEKLKKMTYKDLKKYRSTITKNDPKFNYVHKLIELKQKIFNELKDKTLLGIKTYLDDNLSLLSNSIPKMKTIAEMIQVYNQTFNFLKMDEKFRENDQRKILSYSALMELKEDYNDIEEINNKNNETDNYNNLLSTLNVRSNFDSRNFVDSDNLFSTNVLPNTTHINFTRNSNHSTSSILANSVFFDDNVMITTNVDSTINEELMPIYNELQNEPMLVINEIIINDSMEF